LLTLWAGNQIGRHGDPQPLELASFVGFFNSIWEEGGEAERMIRPEIKEEFLKWLADITGLKQDNISADMAARLEVLFDEVQDEYSQISSEDLDPRFIHLFLLEK
jgi:hypothetical protein